MNLVTIASFPNPTAAHLLRTLLESQEIPATLFNEQIANTVLPLAVGDGGVHLQVRAEDAEEAYQIIERADAEPVEDDIENP